MGGNFDIFVSLLNALYMPCGTFWWPSGGPFATGNSSGVGYSVIYGMLTFV